MYADEEKEHFVDQEYDQEYNEENEDDEREMGLQRMSTSAGDFTTSDQRTQKKRKIKLPRMQVPSKVHANAHVPLKRIIQQSRIRVETSDVLCGGQKRVNA